MAQNSLAEAVPFTAEPQQRPNIEQPERQTRQAPQQHPQGEKLPVSKFEKCLMTVVLESLKNSHKILRQRKSARIPP